ncbi:MAG: helix-turn-helix transcriptional regulator [Clostridiales bacterium]|nr:helix-turn-helix transcriptional regulator [Clostridiales bacterium]
MFEFKNIVLLTNKMEPKNYSHQGTKSSYLFVLFHTNVAISYDGQEYFHSPKDSVIVYEPNTMQYYKNIDSSFRNSFLALEVESEYFEQFNFSLNKLFIIPPIYSERIFYYMDRLSYIINTPYAKELVEDVPKFIEQIFNLLDEAYTFSVKNIKLENPLFVTLFNIKNKMIDDPIKFTTKETSRLFGYSEAYFCKKYKQFFGTSPSQDRKKLIVNIIKRYLETTDFTLEQIAEKCNLSSLPHLISMFRSQEGTTPHQYRIAFKKKISSNDFE